MAYRLGFLHQGFRFHMEREKNRGKEKKLRIFAFKGFKFQQKTRKKIKEERNGSRFWIRT